MKSFSVLALAALGAFSLAQPASWYANRFGFNAALPDLFANQSPTDYKDFAFNTGKPSARFNNSVAFMTGAGMTPTATGKAWNDPTNHQWADVYEITDILPKNTWIRVASNLLSHYPDPYNPRGQVNPERNSGAIITRMMFRGTDLSNGLNILFNLTPGVYPNALPSDTWSSISTDPKGTRMLSSVDTGEPVRRDWWRPYDSYLPYLKNHVQCFVYDLNNAAANIVKQRSPSGGITENFIARLGFQMGNEPAAGHPGGSIDGVVGSWTGVGKVLEGTIAGTDFKPSPATMLSSRIPSSFGLNPCTMPAFSMFSENPDSFRLNYVMGQLRNIQWGGNIAPGLNELATYGKEMNGMAWPTQCGRRALHFNSPYFRWHFNAGTNSNYASKNTEDLLTSQPFDPSQGRWETPQEYAKRWVDEMNRQVDLVANLSMPGSAKLVDITECYFTDAQSFAVPIPAGTKDANNNVVNFQNMTFDQVRAFARSGIVVNGTMVPHQQASPSREAILAAIRTELYNQDMAHTLSPNLGRIYWWGGYYNVPRNETGLENDANNNVISYNPWGDYRLTLSEVKALWNLP